MIIVDGRFDDLLLDREITRQHLQEYGPSFRIELQIRAAESRRPKASGHFPPTRLQTVAHLLTQTQRVCHCLIRYWKTDAPGGRDSYVAPIGREVRERPVEK